MFGWCTILFSKCLSSVYICSSSRIYTLNSYNVIQGRLVPGLVFPLPFYYRLRLIVFNLSLQNNNYIEKDESIMKWGIRTKHQ